MTPLKKNVPDRLLKNIFLHHQFLILFQLPAETVTKEEALTSYLAKKSLILKRVNKIAVSRYLTKLNLPFVFSANSHYLITEKDTNFHLAVKFDLFALITQLQHFGGVLVFVRQKDQTKQKFIYYNHCRLITYPLINGNEAAA
jgi:hypothetical protein